jgi:hypothetical protein
MPATPNRFPGGILLPPPVPTAPQINKPLGLDVAPPKAPSDQAAEAAAFSRAGVTTPDGSGSTLLHEPF